MSTVSASPDVFSYGGIYGPGKPLPMDEFNTQSGGQFASIAILQNSEAFTGFGWKHSMQQTNSKLTVSFDKSGHHFRWNHCRNRFNLNQLVSMERELSMSS